MHHKRPNMHLNRAVADPELVTLRRRLLQPLFNALDKTLLPYLDSGLLIAVSGGPDSRTLMEALARWQHREQGNICIGTIDHGIRRASLNEVHAVVARARVLGFEADYLRVFSHKVGEGDLRHRRYRALFQMAATNQCVYVVTAHHGTDQAEGLVMDLLGTGGGRHGAGMKSRTDFAGGSVLRPFLHLTKRDLESARTAIGVHDVVTDPMDIRGQNMRARVRLGLMAAIERNRPGTEARLIRKSKLRREEEDAFSELAGEVPRQFHENGVFIPLDRKYPHALIRRVIMDESSRLTDRDPRRSAPSLDALMDALYKPGLARSYSFAGVTARLDTQGIHLEKASQERRSSPREIKPLKNS